MRDKAVVKLWTSSPVHWNTSSSADLVRVLHMRAPLCKVSDKNSISLSGKRMRADRSFSSSDKRPKSRITISWRRNLWKETVQGRNWNGKGCNENCNVHNFTAKLTITMRNYLSMVLSRSLSRARRRSHVSSVGLPSATTDSWKANFKWKYWAGL